MKTLQQYMYVIISTIFTLQTFDAAKLGQHLIYISTEPSQWIFNDIHKAFDSRSQLSCVFSCNAMGTHIEMAVYYENQCVCLEEPISSEGDSNDMVQRVKVVAIDLQRSSKPYISVNM